MAESEITIKPENIFLKPRVVRFSHPIREITVMEAFAEVDGVLYRQGLRPLIYDKSGSGLLSKEYDALRTAKGPKVDEVTSSIKGSIVFNKSYHNDVDWSEVPARKG